jgi:hypothetical protein
MSSILFLVYNTGLTTYSGFSFTDEEGNTKTLNLNINESYYLNSSGFITSPSPDIVVYLMSTPSKVMSFESCCDDTKFSFYSIGEGGNNEVKPPFTGLTLNKSIYFNLVENTLEPVVSKSSCFKLVSTGTTIPVGYPLYSTVSFLDTQLNTFVGYPYKNLKGGEIESCVKCNQDYPCPPIPQNFYFKICCETGEPNTNYFGLQLLEGEVSEGFVFYIESDYFTGCATVINLNEFPEGSPLYISENYTLVEYPSCVVCTGSTVGCETKPTPTPTIYYSSNTVCGDGILKRNECDPIVIFPMGVECVIVNPTNTRTTDGRLSLLITGGTPPYTVLWDNGISAPALSNLGVGTYTATVTDSYGDFTIIHSCELTAPTPPPTPTPEPTPTPLPGSTFCLTITTGDYFPQTTQLFFEETGNVVNGRPEYSDGDGHDIVWTLSVPSYWNLENPPGGSDIINPNIDEPPINGWVVNGPSGNITGLEGSCEEYSNLCLDLKQVKDDAYYISTATLFYAGLVNGYPSWEAAANEWVLTWEPIQNQWVLDPASTLYWYTIVNTNPSVPPISGWQQLGSGPESYITITEGNCTTSTARISLDAKINDTVRGNDGNITLKATGGYSPYQYSIDNGSNYQNSPLFNKLSAGTYTTKVEDSSGITATKTVILK